MLAATSLKAYYELRMDRAMQPMEERVVAALSTTRSWAPEVLFATREEIAAHTGMKLSSVCGRVSSLINQGVIKVSGTKEVLGKTQQLLELT